MIQASAHHAQEYTAAMQYGQLLYSERRFTDLFYQDQVLQISSHQGLQTWQKKQGARPGCHIHRTCGNSQKKFHIGPHHLPARVENLSLYAAPSKIRPSNFNRLQSPQLFDLLKALVPCSPTEQGSQNCLQKVKQKKNHYNRVSGGYASLAAHSPNSHKTTGGSGCLMGPGSLKCIHKVGPSVRTTEAVVSGNRLVGCPISVCLCASTAVFFKLF